MESTVRVHLPPLVSILFSIFLLFNASPANAQWAATYGGASGDGASSIQQTSDGGYIVAGQTGSFGGHPWVLKLNADGTPAWQKAYGGASYDWATSIQQTTDGGYIVAGYTQSFGAGNGDLWVLKLRPDGSIDDSCNFIMDTSISGVDSNAVVSDTIATVNNTTVTPSTSSAMVQDTTVSANIICRFSRSCCFQPPLDNYLGWKVTQHFGEFDCEWCGIHLGEDLVKVIKVNDAIINISAGTPVKAIGDGIVKFVGYIPGLGNAVHIQHTLPPGDPYGTEVTSVYYHIQKTWSGKPPIKLSMEPGYNTIKKGDPVGYITNQQVDYGSGPHLHFGIRKGEYLGGFDPLTRTYKTKLDPRTNEWYYPGYTTIYRAPKQTHTISEGGAPAPSCIYSLSPTSGIFPAGGGTGSLNVSSGSGCYWTASKPENVGWITFLTVNSGYGNGTVQFKIAPNTSSTRRRGSITIQGQTYDIIQEGKLITPCNKPLISSTKRTFTANGGDGSLSLVTGSGCYWKASKDAKGNWITITSPDKGNGDATLQYSVAPNPNSTLRPSAAITVKWPKYDCSTECEMSKSDPIHEEIKADWLCPSEFFNQPCK